MNSQSEARHAADRGIARRKTLYRLRKGSRNLVPQLILVISTVIFIYPVLWVIMASFKTGQELYMTPWALPQHPVITNFVRAWQLAHLGKAFINSIVITSATVALILFVSILASFVIGTKTFRGRRGIYFVILMGIMIPIEGLIIPVFMTLKGFGLLNTYLGVILPYAAVGVPFTMFVLVNFFKDIPSELLDSAMIDGASDFPLLWKIIVPLSIPAIIGVGIFQASVIWNELILSLIVLQNELLYTVPLTLATFLRRFVRDWSETFSTLSLSMLPILIVYVIFNRQFVRGMTVGAIKG
jgi:raffinose/stachyose/melibiose transport system permease protein